MIDKYVLTPDIAGYSSDYFCRVCGHVPRTGDVVWYDTDTDRFRCGRCGSEFHKHDSERFWEHSVRVRDLPNKNYPEDWVPGVFYD